MARVIITPPEEYRVVIAGRPRSASATALSPPHQQPSSPSTSPQSEQEAEEALRASRKRKRAEDSGEESGIEIPDSEPERIAARARAVESSSPKRQKTTDVHEVPADDSSNNLEREANLIVRQSGGISPEVSDASNVEVAADLLDIFPGDDEAAMRLYEGRGAKRAFAMAQRAREERERLREAVREAAREEVIDAVSGRDATAAGVDEAADAASLARGQGPASSLAGEVTAGTSAPKQGNGEARAPRRVLLGLSSPKKPSSPLTKPEKVAKKTKKSSKAKEFKVMVDSESLPCNTDEFMSIAQTLRLGVSTALAGFNSDKENEAAEYDPPDEGESGRAGERADRRQGRKPLELVNDSGPHRDRYAQDRDRPITGKRKRIAQAVEVETPKPKFQRLILNVGPQHPQQ
ncbi:MAG: hypothetical protein Q9160_005897 [Pyrenula sp. 1 TL-2023]